MKIGGISLTPTSVKERYRSIENFNESLNGSVYGKHHGGYYIWIIKLDFLTEDQKNAIINLKEDKFVFEDENGYRCYARIQGDVEFEEFFDYNKTPFYSTNIVIVEVVK
jgi:hypothetical protein